MELWHEISNLISGIGKNPTKNLIEATADFLKTSKRADSYLAKNQFSKAEETARLVNWIGDQGLWVKIPGSDRYLTRGAEQSVYLDTDGCHVIKKNDTVFYASWEEYFQSLLIHNLLFPSTAYQLIGFCLENKVLYAVVRQHYVGFTEATDLNVVEKIMMDNGFLRKRNNDYYHPEAQVLIEDLHEENVLTKDGVLFFIDTVICWKPIKEKSSAT